VGKKHGDGSLVHGYALSRVAWLRMAWRRPISSLFMVLGRIEKLEKALFLNSNEEEEAANMVELLAGVVRSSFSTSSCVVFLYSFSPLCSHSLFLGRGGRE